MNPYFEQKILASDPVEIIRLIYQRATLMRQRGAGAPQAQEDRRALSGNRSRL